MRAGYSSTRPTPPAAGNGPTSFGARRRTSTSGCGPKSVTPADVRFLAAWEPPADLQSRFRNLQLLFSTGAGVDQFDFSVLPPHLPVVRMVEPGIVQGMVEYVTHAVLDLHRDMPAYRRAQEQRQWQPLPVRPASERRVGVLGLGSLGAGGARKTRRLRLRLCRLEPLPP